MSCNRENVTWQSADGTWSIGFWEFYDVPNEDGEEWDYEWDVEYGDNFWFVSQGHRTSEAAYQAYTRCNANPGGTTIYEWTRANESCCKGFDAKAEEAKRRKCIVA